MQDSMSYTPELAKPGQVAYPNAPHFHGTGLCQSVITRGDLAGRVVTYDSTGGDEGVKSPANAGALQRLVARGIVYSRSLEDPLESCEDRTVGTVEDGYIYVPTENLLVINTNPYVRVTAGVGEVLGTLRNDTDGGDAVLCGWITVKKVLSSSLALVQVSLSASALPIAASGAGELALAIPSLVATKTYYLPLPDRAITITRIKSIVQGATTTVGSATLTCSINGTAITTGVVTIASGSTVGEQDEASPTALNVADGDDDYLKVVVGGTQADATTNANLVIEYTY